VLMQAGDDADTFFIVLSGQLQVIWADRTRVPAIT
jgi:CRP-like cAMP-binding protein